MEKRNNLNSLIFSELFDYCLISCAAIEDIDVKMSFFQDIKALEKEILQAVNSGTVTDEKEGDWMNRLSKNKRNMVPHIIGDSFKETLEILKRAEIEMKADGVL